MLEKYKYLCVNICVILSTYTGLDTGYINFQLFHLLTSNNVTCAALPLPPFLFFCCSQPALIFSKQMACLFVFCLCVCVFCFVFSELLKEKKSTNKTHE